MIQRLWLWATKRLLGPEWVGTYGGYTVIDTETMDAEELSRILELPAYQEPIDKLSELPDTRGKVYCWHVDSEQKRNRWLKALDQYQDRNGVFESLHIVLVDPEELHSLDSDEIKPYLD